MEKWKPVLGYEGEYEVSDQGRVKSLARKDTFGTDRPVAEKILKISMGGGRRGQHYPQVTLRGRSHLVHRLMMRAFVGLPPPGMQVCHIDGDPTNNRLENLRYDTSKSNAADRTAHGKWTPIGIPGELKPNAKLTVEDVRAIRAWPWRKPGLYKQWPHVAKKTVDAARARRSWKHVP